MLRDLMRAAAEVEPGEPTSPPATDYYQVGIELFGRIEDHHNHVPRSRVRAITHAGIAKRLRPRAGKELLDLLEMRAARLRERRDVGEKADRMNDKYFNPFTKLSHQIGRPPQRERCPFRSVGPNQNPLYCHRVIVALVDRLQRGVG